MVNKKWFLATAYNPETRSVLCCKIEKQMTSKLALVTILGAFKSFKNPHIVYSDIGTQHTSFNFEDVLKIKHLYALKWHPYDKVFIEVFHSILKWEMIYQRCTFV